MKFAVWKRYFIAVGICLSISIVLSVFLMQGFRFVSFHFCFCQRSICFFSIEKCFRLVAFVLDESSTFIKLNRSKIVENSQSERVKPIDSSFFCSRLFIVDFVFSVTILDARPMFGFASKLSDGNFKEFFTIYVGLAVGNSIFTLLRAFTFAYGGIAAARRLHRSLLKSLLKCSISFFDQTPSGRILNRFSSDTWSVDDSLPFILNILLANLFSLLGTLVLACYGLPQFIFVLIPLTIFYYFIQVEKKIRLKFLHLDIFFFRIIIVGRREKSNEFLRSVCHRFSAILVKRFRVYRRFVRFDK